MDPQGQLGKVLGVEVRRARRTAAELLADGALADAALDGPPAPRPGEARAALAGDLPIVATRLAGLDLVVANKALGLASAFDGGDPDPTGRLAHRLAGADLSAYDFVLVDAPPSFGMLTLNVLRAVEEVVVPVPLTFLALDGCAELARTIESVRERWDHPRLRITLVVPTFYRRTRMAQQVLASLSARFPKEIAQTVVGYHVKIDEAQSRGLSIFEYAANDRGARAMAALAQELELRAPTAGAEP